MQAKKLAAIGIENAEMFRMAVKAYWKNIRRTKKQMNG